jgi:prepilin-type N-terminal cleavage/methylation domain-containing protein
MRKSVRGFTLIEVVIAIVIISVAIVPLVLSFGNILRVTVLPPILDTATFLAEKELERVTSARYSAVQDEGPTAYAGDFSEYQYEINVSAVPLTLANDAAMSQYKQVEIIVSHESVGSVSLKTIVTNA